MVLNYFCNSYTFYDFSFKEGKERSFLEFIYIKGISA